MHVVKPKRGKDIEYINENIYDDAVFTSELESQVRSMWATRTADARTTWEDIKDHVRKVSLAATKKLRAHSNTESKRWRTQIAQLQYSVTVGTATQADKDQLRKIKNQVRAQKQNGTLYETLEKEAYNMGKDHDTCTAEFFRQWKPTNAAQEVTAMKTAEWPSPSAPQYDGTHATTPRSVLHEFTKYYRSLFARKHVVQDSKRAYLDKLASGSQVQTPTRDICDAELTVAEMRAVVNNLATRKSPGPDRIPNKFYKTYSKLIATILTEVFNESRREGALPDSCLEGFISVLYKKNDRDDPRNYRPITLLNADYKILTRALTTRMNNAVKQFVSKQQNGFVPDGFIAETEHHATQTNPSLRRRHG
jgi:hypothetical protein